MHSKVKVELACGNLFDRLTEQRAIPFLGGQEKAYLSIERLVCLADLNSLLIASGCDEIQYGFFVAACRRMENRSDLRVIHVYWNML